MAYTLPRSLDAALAALSSEHLTPVAGGTDFYPARVGRPMSDDVLDLRHIPELRGVERTADGLRIGAAATWTEVAEANLPAACHGLQHAARQIGGIQVQNAGTVGGNLCNASPAADSVPPLLTLDARVELASQETTRTLGLDEFLVGYRETALVPGELLVAVTIPDEALTGTSSFHKLGSRSHLVISIVMVAARIGHGDAGIEQAAVAVGACSPVAQRLPALERDLVATTGVEVTEEHLAPLTPIDDVRATADYRHRAAAVLVTRAIDECVGA